jgi:hypothetical protein
VEKMMKKTKERRKPKREKEKITENLEEEATRKPDKFVLDNAQKC